MTLDDFNTSGPTADTSQPATEFGWQATRPVPPGRTELEAFITATRRELHALSESLEHAVHQQPVDASVAPTQPHEPADPAPVPLTTTSPIAETTSDPTQPSAPTLPNPESALPPQLETVPAPQVTQGSTAAAVGPPAGDADPLARLQAIKQRLAQQLENTL